MDLTILVPTSVAWSLTLQGLDVTTGIEGNDIRVKSIDGDHQLGERLDDRLMQHVAEAFKSKHGIDPMTDIIARHDLRSRCVSPNSASP